MSARAWIFAGVLAFAATLHAAEEHGKTDVFAGQGVALAWGVLRGSTEANTFVVIRVVTDPGVYRVVSVTGRDPFTQAERVVIPPTPSSGKMDVRIPREHFADFPRTELRFYEAAPSTLSTQPRLMVFYLGVPDTAPEFDSDARLDAYFAQRTPLLGR